MSAEAWKVFFDWGTVVLVGLTFVFGAGALITGKMLSDRQDEQLRQFDKDLADAKVGLAAQQERAANAEKAAGEANQRAAEANERAASLEVKALTLRKQLLSQGPRANLLTGENRSKLVEALKPFSGQRIDIRHSASTIMVNGKVVMSTPTGDDSLGLANALIGVMKDAGWNSPPTSLISGFQGTGLEVQVLPNARWETMVAADALVKALGKVPIEANGPVLITADKAKRVGTEVILPPLDDNTIILLVLSHQ